MGLIKKFFTAGKDRVVKEIEWQKELAATEGKAYKKEALKQAAIRGKQKAKPPKKRKGKPMAFEDYYF